MISKLFCYIVCFGIIAPVFAHDIGVDRADLTEQGDGNYQLVATAAYPVLISLSSPQLPDHCQYTDNPAGTRTNVQIAFQFHCENGLTGRDYLKLPWQRDGLLVTAYWKDSSIVSTLFRFQNGWINIELAELKAASGTFWQSAEHYTSLGIYHILLGFDHLLFVLALLFIVSKSWTLVKTITAFTVAHSITLGLATFDVINVPSQPVEAVIALSIVFLCVEIMKYNKNNPSLTYRSPWLVAFLFGLLHGLGFAGALSDLGLPQSEIPIALLFFNIGVEMGQLLFVMVILLSVQLMTKFHLSKTKQIRSMSILLIGSLASYWLIERLAAFWLIV